MKVTSDLVESEVKDENETDGLLKRNRKVYTQVVPNCKADR